MTINVSDKVIFLGAGCGIGFVLGALFAPRSGREMRENLGQKVDDLSHKVHEKVQSSGLGDTAQHAMSDITQRGKNVANFARKRINESIESARGRFNDTIGNEVAER